MSATGGGKIYVRSTWIQKLLGSAPTGMWTPVHSSMHDPSQRAANAQQSNTTIRHLPALPRRQEMRSDHQRHPHLAHTLPNTSARPFSTRQHSVGHIQAHPEHTDPGEDGARKDEDLVDEPEHCPCLCLSSAVFIPTYRSRAILGARRIARSPTCCACRRASRRCNPRRRRRGASRLTSAEGGISSRTNEKH